MPFTALVAQSATWSSRDCLGAALSAKRTEPAMAAVRAFCCSEEACPGRCGYATGWGHVTDGSLDRPKRTDSMNLGMRKDAVTHPAASLTPDQSGARDD